MWERYTEDSLYDQTEGFNGLMGRDIASAITFQVVAISADLFLLLLTDISTLLVIQLWAAHKLSGL